MTVVRVTMKCPDALDYARDELSGKDLKNFNTIAGKFFQWDEYVDINVDTDTGTCTVVEQ